LFYSSLIFFVEVASGATSVIIHSTGLPCASSSSIEVSPGESSRSDSTSFSSSSISGSPSVSELFENFGGDRRGSHYAAAFSPIQFSLKYISQSAPPSPKRTGATESYDVEAGDIPQPKRG
uniref:Secreted protein n=1 Tax=Soboliphyme baturini TaxID=241478 RepID=A0A183JAV0_9BILA